MKYPSSALQPRLPMEATAPRREKSRDDLLEQATRLTTVEREALGLKALVGVYTSKGDFFTLLGGSGVKPPGGDAWTHQSVNQVMNRLLSLGLLNADLTCVDPPRHDFSVEIMASPLAASAAQAVHRLFPALQRYNFYYAVSSQREVGPSIRLRLAIYRNDVTAFRTALEECDRVHPTERSSGILETWFAKAFLDPVWLNRLNSTIQFKLFSTKLAVLIATGEASPDLPALLAHYRERENAVGYSQFKWALLRVDLLGGQIALAKQKIHAMADDASTFKPSDRLLLPATIDFLEGRNAQALVAYRAALKLHKKEIGKRKTTFEDYNGLFFLLALIRTGDASVLTEIETQIDFIDADSNRYFVGFKAIEALLLLLRGAETKARVLLEQLRSLVVIEPLSAACLALAEFFVDQELIKQNVAEIEARFSQISRTLPLIARIHAEILARLSPKPAPYTAFLAAPREGAPLIAFTEIIKLQSPWERRFESLALLLDAGAPKLEAPAAPAKSRRLVWYVDLDTRLIEAAEQAAKGAEGWSPGRSIAMKRLFDQDPKLDYFTDADRRALHTIRKWGGSYYRNETYAFDDYKTLLALIGHPLVFDHRHRERRIELVAYPIELVASEQADGYRFALSHRALQPTAFVEAETPTRWRVVDFPMKMLAFQEVLGETGLTVPREGRERVLALLKVQHPNLPIRADIAEADIPSLSGPPEPVLQMEPVDGGLKIAMVTRPFGAAGPFYSPGIGGQSVLATIDGARRRARRDLDAERALASALATELTLLEEWRSGAHGWEIEDPGAALEFLLRLGARVPAVPVEWPEGRRVSVRGEVSTANLSLKIGQAREWFQIDGQVQVDADLLIDMRDLLSRLDNAQGRFVRLADGAYLALTERFRQQLQRLDGISQAHGDGRRIPALASVAARELIDEAGKLKADKAWKAFVERLNEAGRLEPELPSTLQADLRDYQLEGFRWLSRLAHWRAGAVLADDMGLGKTVQAIAAMLEQAPHGPSLVLAPTSVCHNWENELSRFAPSLNIRRFGAGGGRAEIMASLAAMDVLVISYGLLHQEADGLAEIDWRMVVFDEAQAIKNAETRRAQASQRLKAEFRLALTGTPIENYLDELWSLFAIVNPGLLGSRESFARRFAGPIERNRDASALQSLRALIRPFMLRRTKSAVLSELPPRTEVTLEIDLPDEERAFYEALRLRAMESLAALGDAGQTRIHILAEIMRLRRACCHPGLVDPATALPGAKLQAFLDLVDELTRNKHKALVFSQFVGQLERVREALVARGVSHQYLDGSTPAPERQKRVAAFQAGQGDLFLISLRAGGAGLNLTAADYVIHLDPWWNPAVEDQASDRAHRIGQSRPVTVYRLIVRDSIEEKILALHRSKRDLASDLLEGTEVSGKLSQEDLLNLIRA